jgi:spore coat polysaccharide biosynthesis predicted glycosyltransferase SpsG
MRLVFRADASKLIGSGHIMRCSAIAEEAVLRGIPAIMIGSTGGLGWIEDHLNSLGLPLVGVKDFNLSHRSTLDTLILDSYIFDREDSFLSHQHWQRIVALVDDVTPEYRADLFIHPGINGKWFKGQNDNFISGLEYIPFRKSIHKSRIYGKLHLNKVLIFGGGTDVFGFASAVGRFLIGQKGFDEAVFISLEKEKIESWDKRFRVEPFGASLDREIANADLVLTTSSTSSLEVLAREIPLGVGCAVDNQVSYYKELIKLDVAAPLGVRTNKGGWNLNQELITALLTSAEMRNKLLRNASGVVDLSGASRIVDAILKL